MSPTANGIHAPVPRDRMVPPARKLRDTYAITPGAPLFKREFGYYCLERWYEQGLPRDADLAQEFDYDPSGDFGLRGLGWCEAAFVPAFEECVIEDRGEHEVVQDAAGRHLLCFKGRRSGFMPEYLDHPVKDMRTWEKHVKWRLDPATPERYADLDERMAAAAQAAGEGKMIVQHVVGGYMYLRSLIGPESLLYMVYDDPALIHDCMRTWLKLALEVTRRHQEYLTFDEIFFGEDICYNHGLLISPGMMQEFIIPYYRELISAVKEQQIDRSRHLFVHVDTDGYCVPALEVYREAIGMDVMSPFEVAAGCDVVTIGRQYPELVMKGGIDKRVLAKGRAAIDAHLEHIVPAMRARGGYIPMCDHGVPEEVTLENYRYYRRRCAEMGS